MEALKPSPPDLMPTELMMPITGGKEMLVALRQGSHLRTARATADSPAYGGGRRFRAADGVRPRRGGPRRTPAFLSAARDATGSVPQRAPTVVPSESARWWSMRSVGLR